MATSAFAGSLLLLLLSLQLLLAVAGRTVPGDSDTDAAPLLSGLDGAERDLFDDSLVPEHRVSNSTRRLLAGGCRTGNPIDDCWRCENWSRDRKKLASCALGYGSKALGGYNGRYYIVTDSSDDSPDAPKPGTLRFGLAQIEPLWIIFQKDMMIRPTIELMVASYKTIDGRGANVEIAYGACLTIQDVTDVIIHSVKIHHCRSAGPGLVMSNVNHVGHREKSDGDGISVFTASNIWVDHVYLAQCEDGLLDCIHSSTDISITNSYFEHHDKVMLLGHNDAYTEDKNMRVTVAFNKFGPGLIQRLPRCRFGVFHVYNNDYTSGWGIYAVGGSADPTIISQGNVYSAGAVKEVTHRDVAGNNWQSWLWKSSGDEFLNGAYFVQSGSGRSIASADGSNINALPASEVPAITAYAGSF